MSAKDVECNPVTARESALLRGLVDWVALDHIHWDVAQENQGSPLTVVQTKTLELIRSLVDEGLAELGDLASQDGAFTPWNSSLDESIERIRNVYVAHFHDENVWPWYAWLNLTEEGDRVAQEIESSTQSQAERDARSSTYSLSLVRCRVRLCPPTPRAP